MRVRINEPEAPHYAKKIIKKFLLLPLTINGERRWLEVAEIELIYLSVRDTGWCWCYNRWIN